MNINAELVKTLRKKTNAGVMDCKEALKEAGGDMEEAVKILRKKGYAKMAKRVARETQQGLISSYIHAGGKLGVLVEVNCESDFVAKTAEFRQLVKDITMHVAACDPVYIRREEVPEKVIAQEKEIAASEFSGKPEHVVENISKGRLEKFYKENCLLEQPFVKNEDITIGEHIASCVAGIGENVRVRRFIRYQLGEEL